MFIFQLLSPIHARPSFVRAATLVLFFSFSLDPLPTCLHVDWCTLSGCLLFPALLGGQGLGRGLRDGMGHSELWPCMPCMIWAMTLFWVQLKYTSSWKLTQARSWVGPVISSIDGTPFHAFNTIKIAPSPLLFPSLAEQDVDKLQSSMTFDLCGRGS
jgi:hypothetical protein